MASLDSLTESQRAILQLLLKRGKSYGEIETMLKLAEGTAQTRAHEAITALGPDRPQLGEALRHEIADYLLGQQSGAVSAATRVYLGDSAAGRAWARDVAGSLQPLAAGELPDVPSEPAPPARPASASGTAPAQVESKSRLSNNLILAALGVAVVIAVILIVGISGDDSDKSATSTVTRTGATTPGNSPQTISQGKLAAPSGSDSDASAETGIIRYPQTNNFKLLVAGKNLQPPPQGASYGVWLYSSRSENRFLGFPEATVSEEGNLDIVADLAPDTPNFKEVLVTLETEEEPSLPGRIVLRGDLVVAQSAQPDGASGTQPG
ncbi:MAG: RNA polymerase sigma factor [Solirubrobacteraceae bacterium]